MKTRLAKLGIDFPFMVAPMVGITNLPFRELVRSYLPPNFPALLFTEMLSSRRLASSKLNTLSEVRFKADDPYLVPQLLANEEKFIAPSLKRLREAKVFGVDINMGCPVTQALKYNWGVKLMGDIGYAARVVAITKRDAGLPVSVKLRAGTGDTIDMNFLHEFTAALEGAGADWLSIHARTQAQKHRGKANWEAVGAVAKRRSIAIVANGDIQTAADAIAALRDFGCDGAMVGRAAVVRPWILLQIADDLGLVTNANVPRTPRDEGRAYYEACCKLLGLYRESFTDESIILKQFTFFVAHSVKWFKFGHFFWKEVNKCKTVAELADVLENYAHVDQFEMAERIEN